MKKNNGIIICVGIIVIMGFLFFKNRNVNLNVEQIKKIIPDDVINYEYNGEKCTSKVENIKIIRQSMDEKTSSIDCEIELKDDKITRIAYLRLNCKYYEQGGWNVENYSINEDEVLKEWNYADTQRMAEDNLKEAEYRNYKLKSSKVAEYNWSNDNYLPQNNYVGNQMKADFVYDINESYEYLSLTGELTCSVILGYDTSSNYYTSEKEYPVYYNTELVVDTSNLLESWKVNGEWKGNIQSNFNSYGIDLNLKYINDKDIDWNANCEYNGELYKNSGIIERQPVANPITTYVEKYNNYKELKKLTKISNMRLEYPIEFDFSGGKFYLSFAHNMIGMYPQSEKKYRIKFDGSPNEALYTITPLEKIK